MRPPVGVRQKIGQTRYPRYLSGHGFERVSAIGGTCVHDVLSARHVPRDMEYAIGSDANRRCEAGVVGHLRTGLGIADAFPCLAMVGGTSEAQGGIRSPDCVNGAVVRTARVGVGVNPLLVIGGIGMQLDWLGPGLASIRGLVYVHAHAREVGIELKGLHDEIGITQVIEREIGVSHAIPTCGHFRL